MNELMKDENTVIIDMRNHYEFEVGHFEKAIEIPSDTFRDQLPMAVDMMKEDKEKNIIMYCTGGIRCEKASALLLARGSFSIWLEVSQKAWFPFGSVNVRAAAQQVRRNTDSQFRFRHGNSRRAANS